MRDPFHYQRWVFVADRVYNLIKYAMMCMLIAWLAYIAKEITFGLAGKTTLAEIGVSIMLATSTRERISYAANFLLVLLVFREWHLRRKKVKKLAKRVVDLERHIDPNRSSSQLTSTGDTRREDR